MEQKKPEQHKKEHAGTGSCSTGGGMNKTGSCGSSADVKKTEHTGSCSTGDGSKKGSCH